MSAGRRMPVASNGAGVFQEDLVDVPKPPPGLTRDEQAGWRDLWRHPSAKWWLPEDGVFILRLVRLRGRLDREGDDAPGWLYGALAQIEKALFLAPSTRTARMRAAATEPAPARRPQRRQSPGVPTARERDRLLRG